MYNITILTREGSQGLDKGLMRSLGLVEASVYSFLYNEDNDRGLIEAGYRFPYFETYGSRDEDGFFNVESQVFKNFFGIDWVYQKKVLETLIKFDLIKVKGLSDEDNYKTWTISVLDNDSAKMLSEEGYKIIEEDGFNEWVK